MIFYGGIHVASNSWGVSESFHLCLISSFPKYLGEGGIKFMRPGFQSNFQANSKKRASASAHYVCTWRKPTNLNLGSSLATNSSWRTLDLFDETISSTHH